MKINTSIFDPLRPDRGASSDKVTPGRTGEAAKSGAQAAPAAKGRDTVQISDDARTLAARAEKSTASQMDPARVSELRRK
ncbi:MAG: hypothetical protein M3Y64_06935, partial [Gemmatimonadota bacterium]|nr:hypothetical protein [Gemmatimonadota bacterium]